MARDESIDLDTFKTSSYLDPNFVLTVQPCALVSLPDALRGHLSAEELRDRVKSGSLWVTRAASCYFELKADFYGLPSGAVKEDLVHVVIKAFESHPAWQILGVDIRRDYNQFLGLPGADSSYTYSIHHAQASTGLVSPTEVPNILLSKVVCNMTFGPRKVPEAGIRVGDLNKPRSSRVITMQLPRHQLQNIAARSFTRKRSERQPGLRSAKPKAVTAQELCPNLQASPKGNLVIYHLEASLRDSRIENLTYVAINLMLGTRKRFFGFKSDRKLNYPTLLDIAPAVWNAHYFQEIMSRADLAPLISSALGSMMRRSPAYLGHNTQHQVSDPAATLQKHITRLILRSTSPRFPGSGGRSASSNKVTSQNNPGLAVEEGLVQRAQSLCSFENSIRSQDSVSSFIDVEGDQDIELNLSHPLGESGTLYGDIDLGQHQDLTQMPAGMNQDYDYIPRCNHLSDKIGHVSTDILDGELEEHYQCSMRGHEPSCSSAISQDDDIACLDSVGSAATSFVTYNRDCIPEHVRPNSRTSIEGSRTDCQDNDTPDEMYLEAEKERAMLLGDEFLLSALAASD